MKLKKKRNEFTSKAIHFKRIFNRMWSFFFICRTHFIPTLQSFAIYKLSFVWMPPFFHNGNGSMIVSVSRVFIHCFHVQFNCSALCKQTLLFDELHSFLWNSSKKGANWRMCCVLFFTLELSFYPPPSPLLSQFLSICYAFNCFVRKMEISLTSANVFRKFEYIQKNQ